MKSLKNYLILLSYSIFLISCNSGKSGEHKLENLSKKDSAAAIVAQEIQVKYRIDSIADTAALRVYHEKYTADQQMIIGALNRIDPWRIRAGKKIVLPDTLLPDIMYYSPYPAQLDLISSFPKFILVNQRIQAVALYENGKLIRWGPCSSGRKAKPTPNGLFHTNYKKKLKISTVDGDWKMPWYFNIANFDGIGLHQYELPGYPASHSCIRLFKQDAIYIFNWADTWEVSKNGQTITKKGTPVIVFGKYDFSGTPAWKEAANDPDVLKLSEEDMNELKGYLEKEKGVNS